MSHHIDDIFKRKLEKASLDGHLDDWSNARTLLNLDRPKRRIFLWLWMGLVLLLIGGAYSILTHSNSIFTNKEIAIDEKALTKSKTYTTASQSSNSIPTSREILQTADVDQETKLIVSTELSPTTDLNNLSHGNLDEEVLVLKSENSNTPAAQNNEFYDSKLETNNSAIDHYSADQNIGLRQVASNSFNRKGEVTNNLINDKIKNTDANNNSDSGEVLSNLVSTNVQNTDLELTRDLSEIAQFEILTKLKIESLENDMEVPDPPLIFESKEDKMIPFDLSFGIYAGIDPFRTQLSAGLLVNHNFNAKWSINMGIGVRRYSNERMRGYSALAVRSLQNAQVTSSNSYKTVSLDLPVRISFHANRHSIFVGGMVERPFSLNGTQEVTYLEEELAVDAPVFDPGFAPPAPQVVTATQSYNLQAVPEQKRFFFYSQFGYGYNFSERFQISGSAAYRINSKSSVSPLLDTDQLGLNDASRWSLELRLSYLFN